VEGLHVVGGITIEGARWYQSYSMKECCGEENRRCRCGEEKNCPYKHIDG
jgi:hypothetical protein